MCTSSSFTVSLRNDLLEFRIGMFRYSAYGCKSCTPPVGGYSTLRSSCEPDCRYRRASSFSFFLFKNQDHHVHGVMDSSGLRSNCYNFKTKQQFDIFYFFIFIIFLVVKYFLLILFNNSSCVLLTSR